MYIVNDNTFNHPNSILTNDNKYVKITLMFKLIGVTW